jgi:hypothetical protein
MSILRLLSKHISDLETYRIDQIVQLAGEGKLRDGSACSAELIAFLKKVSLEKLSTYIQQTLTEKFTDSGFVLQDLVNEVGGRLGFSVNNGRYHGVVNQSGHDGLWVTKDMRLVVEVKTTDAYRVNVTNIATYASKLKSLEPSDEQQNFGILIVVGRQDTGDLEAQIRGSKFAWDVRIISAEALIDLAKLSQTAVDEETEVALRHSLLPVEFTRVDHLVSLLSRVAFDVERAVHIEELNPPYAAEQSLKVQKQELIAESPTVLVAESTDSVKEKIVKFIQASVQQDYEKNGKSIVKFSSGNAYVISVSKYYQRNEQNYWYALQARWLDFLKNQQSFLCLGMSSEEWFLKVPSEIVRTWPDQLNKTEKLNSKYWHLGLIKKNDGIFLLLPKTGKLQDLTEFKVKI